MSLGEDDDDEIIFKSFGKKINDTFDNTSYSSKYKNIYNEIHRNIRSMQMKGISDEEITTFYNGILHDRIDEFKEKRSAIIQYIRDKGKSPEIDENLKSMYRRLQDTGFTIKNIKNELKQLNQQELDDNDDNISVISDGYGGRRNKHKKSRKTKKSKKCKRRKTNRRK